MELITGCAVAQHYCEGDQPFQWETPKFASLYNLPSFYVTSRILLRHSDVNTNIHVAATL